MKKVLIVLIGMIFTNVAKGQSITFLSSPDKPMKDKTVIDLPAPFTRHSVATLRFRIDKIENGQDITIAIEDKDQGTAIRGSDYEYINHTCPYTETFSNTTGSVISRSVTVDIRTITTKKTNAIISIRLTCPGKYDKLYKVEANFNTDADLVGVANKVPDVDTSKWYLRIVTGGNFDFFNAPSIKNFAGDISAFVPNAFKVFGRPFGVEFCLNNYHYYNTDSTRIARAQDAYYLHYKDAYKSDSTVSIINRTTTFNRKWDYNVWGFTIAPLIQLQSNDFAQLYLKIHLEGHATTEIYSPLQPSTVNDTIPRYQYKGVVSAHPHDPIKYLPYTFYDFYWGMGLPIKINMKNKLILEVSPTVGFASVQTLPFNEISPTVDPSQRNALAGPPRETKGFFLSKFQLVTTVAPVDIALGGEYRAVVGKMHYLNTYIGVSLTLDKLKR